MNPKVLEYRSDAAAARLKHQRWWQRHSFVICISFACVSLVASVHVAWMNYRVFSYFGPNNADYNFWAMKACMESAALLILLLYTSAVIASYIFGKNAQPIRGRELLAVIITQSLAIVVPLAEILF